MTKDEQVQLIREALEAFSKVEMRATFAPLVTDAVTKLEAVLSFIDQERRNAPVHG